MEPTLSQALHLLNGDTVNAKIAARRADPQADDHQEVPRGTDHRALHPLPVAQADQGRAGEARADPEPRARTKPRRSKTSSGPCSTAASFCSTIDRSRHASSDLRVGAHRAAKHASKSSI